MPAFVTPRMDRIGLETAQSIYQEDRQVDMLQITEKISRITKANTNRGTKESAFRFNSSARVCHKKEIRIIKVFLK
jgi:hypothetical protein